MSKKLKASFIITSYISHTVETLPSEANMTPLNLSKRPQGFILPHACFSERGKRKIYGYIKRKKRKKERGKIYEIEKWVSCKC